MTRKFLAKDVGLRFPKATESPTAPGRLSLDESTLKLFREKFNGLEGSKEYKRIARWLEPRAMKARRRRAAIVARSIDNPVAHRLVKQADQSELRKKARNDLSELSHKIAFVLGGADPVTKTGPCYTCTATGTMTWGHFIAQGDSDLLRYHPHNTRPQCNRCQKEGQGMYREFRARLEREKPGRAAALEADLMRYGKRRFRLRHIDPELSLEHRLGQLRAYWDRIIAKGRG